MSFSTWLVEFHDDQRLLVTREWLRQTYLLNQHVVGQAICLTVGERLKVESTLATPTITAIARVS